jgi:hypothetical protein
LSFELGALSQESLVIGHWSLDIDYWILIIGTQSFEPRALSFEL